MIPYTIVQCKVLRKKYNKTKINTCCAKNLFFYNFKTQKEQKILLALFSTLCFKLTIVHYRIKYQLFLNFFFLSASDIFLASASFFACSIIRSISSGNSSVIFPSFPPLNSSSIILAVLP